MTHPVLVISGPTGVGKSTVAYELGSVLRERDVPHALVETDELDRIWPPQVQDPSKEQLTEANLRAVWDNLTRAGATRLILVGVMPRFEKDLAWVLSALPDAALTVVRLVAPLQDLTARLAAREIGSDLEAHIDAAKEQLLELTRERADDHIVVDTGSRSVRDIASEVLAAVRW